jgi:FkbM family methyltransferase
MKILYIAPHLSTGGCPQYLLKKIQVLVKEHEVYCVEYSNHGGFTVQRNQIKEILKDKFFELGENKMEVMDIINKINPEVVHLEEMPEYFMDGNLAIELYSKDRKYKLIETSHDSSFNPQSKTMFPDKILFVSKYQMETLKSLDVPMDVCEYPIVINPRKPREEALKVLGLDPNKKHVINVGLFTPRKNQAEIIEYAKQLRNYPIQFHFIGNQADNFKFYWEPLMKDFPLNCTWWNERKDVHNFYQAADLFLFTSRGTNNDKETSPLVIREAISYNIPSLIYNLPVYLGMYDKYGNIQYLNFDSLTENSKKILQTLQINPDQPMIETPKKEEDIKISYDRSANKIDYVSKYPIPNAIISVKDIDSRTVLYASEHEVLQPNINYWIIPVPKQFRDFETDVLFGGMTVEVYSNNEIIYSTDFRIRPISVEKPLLKTKNHTSPSYNNYMEFFIHKVYEKYIGGKKFDTIVDVGANIGIWIEYIKHASTCGKIYAIEPNIQALTILKDTYAQDEIILVEKALTNKDGELEFFVDGNNSTISSAQKYEDLNSSYKVPAISFRTFLREYNIDRINLMKVDIETGEYDLFESMDKSDLDRIDNLLIEYHIGFGGRDFKDVKTITSLLRGAGYDYILDEQHSRGGFIFATKK